MPSTTARQHRAMQAAKHGKSTLGIPTKVGKDFIAADKKAGKPKRRKRTVHAAPRAGKSREAQIRRAVRKVTRAKK